MSAPYSPDRVRESLLKISEVVAHRDAVMANELFLAAYGLGEIELQMFCDMQGDEASAQATASEPVQADGVTAEVDPDLPADMTHLQHVHRLQREAHDMALRTAGIDAAERSRLWDHNSTRLLASSSAAILLRREHAA